MVLELLLIGLVAAVANPNNVTPTPNILLQFIKPDQYCDPDLSNPDLKSFYNNMPACNSNFVRIGAFDAETDANSCNFMIDVCLKNSAPAVGGTGAVVCFNQNSTAGD